VPHLDAKHAESANCWKYTPTEGHNPLSDGPKLAKHRGRIDPPGDPLGSTLRPAEGPRGVLDGPRIDDPALARRPAFDGLNGLETLYARVLDIAKPAHPGQVRLDPGPGARWSAAGVPDWWRPHQACSPGPG